MDNTSQNKSVFQTFAVLAVALLVFGGIALLVNTNDKSGTPADRAVSPNSNSFGSALIGKPVAEFSLKDRNGVVYTPESLKGKNVVLFFNEGLMCYPACWNQIVALATDGRLQTADTVALSVVTDPANEWQSAIQKMPTLGKATILHDTDKSLSRELGMLAAPSSMHYGSYPGHSFVVIDKQGIVRFVYDDPRMGIDNELIVQELKKLE
ncbi:MAG: hypothetical protein UX77_C0035G0006 [Parcubacteria group bacterium GW2011_GWA1_47_11]|nr:MAG: hypothetical protein UX77_C0035G0006 [Parcubacteria group bacterium GW2011_GWA1_47_11]